VRTLLRIDASARVARSITRGLTRRFVDRWVARRPGDRVLVRDVGREPPPAVSEARIRAAFMAEAERDSAARAALAVSETLIDELAAAASWSSARPCTIMACRPRSRPGSTR
jgi:FMN-dependent NADH-azoreductase